MGMELRHEFTVPATVEETWEAFNDIESVATCFPGASVSTVDGDTFTGSCKVKLGPVSLVYNGTGTFVEKDESARRMVIDAMGKDKRGNGTAGAHVTATMTEDGTSTRVEVLTDLNITGKPAQFGRGVMQDVSDKLLGQFTACLEQKVGDSSAASTAAAAATDEPEPQGGDRSATEPADRPDQSPNGLANPRLGTHDLRGMAAPVTSPPGHDEALDLGATVLPVLAKAYWKQGLATVFVLVLLARLLRRRR